MKQTKACCAFRDTNPMLCDHHLVVGKQWRIDVCGPGSTYAHSVWREPSRTTRAVRAESAMGLTSRQAVVSELLRLLGAARAACAVTHADYATVIDHGDCQATAHLIEEPVTFEEYNQ